MTIYLSIFIFISLFSLLDFIKVDFNKKIYFYWFLYLLLTLFIGLRGIGPDFYTYYNFYVVTPDIKDLFNIKILNSFILYSRFEPGYILFCSIFKTLQIPFGFFNLAFSAIFVYLFFKKLPSYTKYPFIAVAMYFAFAYLIGWSALRQFIAASIFFYGVDYFIKGEKKKFFISLLICSLFHISAIILIPFFWIIRIKINLIRDITIIIALFIFGYLGLISRIGYNLAPFLPFIHPEKIKLIGQTGEFNVTGNISLIWFMLVIFISWNYKRIKIIYPNFEIPFRIFVYGYITFLLASSIGDLGRVSTLFKIFFPVIITYAILMIKGLKGKLLVLSVFILISGVLSYKTIIDMDKLQGNDVFKFVPYKTWLNNELYNSSR